MITKVVFSTAITLIAALASATPAGADPSVFGPLRCSCTQPVEIPHDKLAVKDQVERGIQNGIASAHGGSPNPGDF